MLIEPEGLSGKIASILQYQYEINIDQIKFLPIGADQNTIVYKVNTVNQLEYFVKLRKEHFSEASILIPEQLHSSNVSHIIPTIKTIKGESWFRFDNHVLIVHPYIEGKNAAENGLSIAQMFELGALLKSLHSLKLPMDIKSKLPIESFNSGWSEKLLKYLSMISTFEYKDSIQLRLKSFINENNEKITVLINEAEKVSKIIPKTSDNFVVCHADFHAYNLLVTEKEDFYLIDFDTVILAPKERDMMFIGAKIDALSDNQDAVSSFYEGYGIDLIDKALIRYYRLNRILEDLVVDCELILAPDLNIKDREQSLKFLISNFQPGNTIEAALED